ncbi:hypothetical protein LCGC14_2569180 [marine sediment metagenome]|uniref:Uncharacterized protein n=1 Tax=marine sediment metagenome TaxID=412755 RepID=A0A0F9CTS6_9ZZZZ
MAPRSDGIAKLALDIVDELLGAPPVTVAGQVRRKEHLDYIVSKLRAHLGAEQPAVDVDALAEHLARELFGGAEQCLDTIVPVLRAHLAPAPGVVAPTHAKMLDHVTEPAEPFRLDADSVRFRGITRWLGTLEAEQQAIGEIALRALAARNVLRQAQEKPDAQRSA